MKHTASCCVRLHFRRNAECADTGEAIESIRDHITEIIRLTCEEAKRRGLSVDGDADYLMAYPSMEDKHG